MMQIGHWFFKSCRIFVAVALCQRETFLCHSLWQRANTWSIMFENLQGGQFNYIINSVDSTKLPCYTLPQTQHDGFLRNLPPFIHIFYLLLNYFKTILLFYFSNLFFLRLVIQSVIWSVIRSNPILVLSRCPHSY